MQYIIVKLSIAVKTYLVGKIRMALLMFTRLFRKVPILLHTEQIGRVFIGASVVPEKWQKEIHFSTKLRTPSKLNTE